MKANEEMKKKAQDGPKKRARAKQVFSGVMEKVDGCENELQPYFFSHSCESRQPIAET